MAQTIEQKYAAAGHPSIAELKLAQGTIPTSNPRQLIGDFWPEEENIDDFRNGDARPSHFVHDRS
jgi:hypothetical protein